MCTIKLPKASPGIEMRGFQKNVAGGRKSKNYCHVKCKREREKERKRGRNTEATADQKYTILNMILNKPIVL